MAVQINKQRGLACGVAASVEFGAAFVIHFRCVGVRGEQPARACDEIRATGLEMLVEGNQIGVGVGKQAGRIRGVEKNGAGADERFEQPFSRGERLPQMAEHAVFPAGPFQERFHQGAGSPVFPPP